MLRYLTARQEIIAASRRLSQLGIQMSTGGNLSARLPDEDLVLIKPTGVSLSECSEQDLLVVDREGNVVEGVRKPTKEIRFHLGIYRVRPEINGVCHVHAPAATAYACAGLPLDLVTVHSRRVLGEVPCLPPALDGSLELARMVEEAFSDPRRRAVLLGDHGMISTASSIRDAEMLAELVEETAQIALLSRQLLAFTNR